jgi:GTP-binding protein HflX
MMQNRCIIIGVCLNKKDQQGKQNSLQELKKLAETAGLQAEAIYMQNRKHLDATYFAGKGFIAKALAENSTNILLFDNELSPSQARNIEKDYEAKVIDRTELILDIFHAHAKTKEARLQVELAELEYQLPRLKRLWSHLDRERGQASGTGGASRGMGEKQLEVDKRKVRREIALVKKELEKISQQKETQRKNRSKIDKICLVGYTNAGKSTLFNKLTDAGVLVQDKLFATLETTTRTLQLPKGNEAILSDTVGFISNLPHHLVASFRATLKDVQDADLLLHVVDSSDKNSSKYITTVNQVLQQLEAQDIPQILVLNKLDRVEPKDEISSPNSIKISARTGANISQLIEMIDDKLHQNVNVELQIPHTQQQKVNLLHNSAKIVKKEYNEKGLLVEAIINKCDLKRFRKYLVKK